MKLEIQLDRPDGVYLAGDTISGIVTITDPDGGRGKIQLVREWRAQGKGNEDFGSRSEMTLAETWAAGISQVPFSFQMPDGPFTYRGTNTNLDWYVRAKTGGMFKTRAETNFIFGAVPNMPTVDFGPSYTKPVTFVKANSGLSGVAISLIFAGGALAFLAFLYFVIQPPLVAMLLFVVLVVGGGGLIVYMLVRNSLAQARLGDMNLVIKPIELQPNQHIQIRFSTTVKADFECQKIEVKLVQNEFYAKGSGKNRTTHTAPVLTQVISVSEQRFLRAREKLDFAVDILIPDGAATTFSATNNKVTWQVVITMPIKNWSDWQHIQDITVRP